MNSPEPFRVVIAGAGVAGLEAALALRSYPGLDVEVELLSPEGEFAYRPLAFAEPFARGEMLAVPMPELLDAARATQCVDRLRAVDPSRRVVSTEAGRALHYDALLLATGVRGVNSLPGALTYSGEVENAALAGLLAQLEEGEVRSVAFAAPIAVRWGLPLYELALLTAEHLREHGIDGVTISLVTPEREPLGLFGHRAAEEARRLLVDAGVDLRLACAPTRVEDGFLVSARGDRIPAERVVTLPRLEVPPIPGIPQGPSGFIGTDAFMRVDGLARVWAAGDATWFPIKQGGLAAQQADSAASAIAACVDPEVERVPFRPVLRGALLTGRSPRYLRTRVGDRDDASASSEAPLWWPPSKIAARHLAPVLARQSEGNQPRPPLEDLETPSGEESVEMEQDHRDAVALALTAADADAHGRDFRGALRWLEVAEQLDVTLPPDYLDKRRHWEEEAGA